MKKVAVYPGSFDPLTNGHIDIIEKTLAIFDKIIVAISINPAKKTLFTVKERLDILYSIYSDKEKVEITSFEGLLVNFVTEKGANTIVRGLRVVSDFEYELQMSLMNSRLAPLIKSVYLMPSSECSYISSSLIKEIYSLGGNIEGLIPIIVEKALRKKFS